MGSAFDHGFAQGTDSPYEEYGRFLKSHPAGNMSCGSRIETDPYLQAHARHAWNLFKGPPIPPKYRDKVSARSAEAVRRIRARGGEVIFVRPPRLQSCESMSSGGCQGTRLGSVARGAMPRESMSTTWRRRRCSYRPNWSHLSGKCATVFTDAYVRRLVQLTPRLKLRADAPPPLTRSDCV